MAKYRQLYTDFWNDGFIVDITPQEKFFYLYILTNCKTSQCGIYELPKRTAEKKQGLVLTLLISFLKGFVSIKRYYIVMIRKN